MVTYGDAMTLLLCFFVMLLTFSSFEKVTWEKLAGAFSYETMGSIFPHRQTIPEGMLPMVDQPAFTDKGSETKNEDEVPREIKNPRKPKEILNKDAYKARRVFYIPSEKLFDRNGLEMMPQGLKLLDQVAAFLRVKPCFVVINESRNATGRLDTFVQNASLERSWLVVQHFTGRHRLPAGYFSVVADGGALSRKRFAGRGVVEIALISLNTYK